MLDAVDRLGKIAPGLDGVQAQRARILVGVCVLVFVMMPPLVVTGLALGAAMSGIAMVLLVLAAHALALVLIRTGRIDVTAAMVCITINAALVFCGIHHDGMSILLHPITLAMPCLTVYLLGTRFGMMAFALVLVEVVVGYFLHDTGRVLAANVFPSHGREILVQLAVEAAVFVGGINWLHSEAHSRSTAALASAVSTLRASEAKLVNLIDNTQDMVCLIDMDFHVVRANAAMHAFALRMTGRPFAVGSSFFSNLNAERSEYWRQKFFIALGGDQLLCDQVFDLPNGKVYVEYTIAAVPYSDGSPLGLTMFARDVTARKADEAKLLEAHAQLRHVQKLQAIGTLSGGIAHEINNPLSSVISNLSILRDELRALSPQMPKGLLNDFLEYGGDALTGAERIKRIVNDIRAFSRTEEEPRFPVDVLQVVRAAIDACAKDIAARGELVVKLSPVPLVMGNELSLKETFVHLILNATEALAVGVKGGTVGVETRVLPDGKIAIEISDNGVGMSPALLERVFEPFFTTKSVGKGTGLGLSICHGTVSRLGGDITVDSTVGKGTTVRVVLPPSA